MGSALETMLFSATLLFAALSLSLLCLDEPCGYVLISLVHSLIVVVVVVVVTFAHRGVVHLSA